MAQGRQAGGVDREESYQALNMGIGMVLIVEPAQVEAVGAALREAGEEALAIGRITSGSGVVRWADR